MQRFVSDRLLYRLAFRVAVLAFIMFALTIVWNHYFTQTSSGSTQRIDPVRSITESDHVQGSRTAPVEIVLYTDLECQFCKRFHEVTRPALLKKYGDTIVIVYRNFPMLSRPKAQKEAEAAECVNTIGGQDAYWAFIDRVFAITPSNNGLDLSMLPDIARDAGVDRTKFKQCLDSGASVERVGADIAEGTIAGVTQTPTILIRSAGRSLFVTGDYPSQIQTGVDYVRAVATPSL